MSMFKANGAGNEKEDRCEPVAPADASSAPAKAIDVTKIEMLRKIAEGASFVSRLAGTFIAHSRTVLAGVEAAVSANDCPALRKLAHSLKSSSAYLGATRFSQLCAELERTALEGDAQACAVLAREMIREFERAEHELKAYV